MTLSGGATVLYEGDWATRGPETSWNGDWELIGERGRLTWTGTATDVMSSRLLLQLHGERPRPLPLPDLELSDRAASPGGVRRGGHDQTRTGNERPRQHSQPGDRPRLRSLDRVRRRRGTAIHVRGYRRNRLSLRLRRSAQQLCNEGSGLVDAHCLAKSFHHAPQVIIAYGDHQVRPGPATAPTRLAGREVDTEPTGQA